MGHSRSHCCFVLQTTYSALVRSASNQATYHYAQSYITSTLILKARGSLAVQYGWSLYGLHNFFQSPSTRVCLCLTSFPNRDCPMIATLILGSLDFALKCMPGMVCNKYLLYRAVQGVVLGRMRKPCRTAARDSENTANIRI